MSIILGGDAGQGIESSGHGFGLALKRAGYHVFAMNDFRSRIRGGNNFHQLRASTYPVSCHRDPAHVVIALTSDAFNVHLSNLAKESVVIFDTDLKVDPKKVEEQGGVPIPAPLIEIGERNGSRLMMNTAALGIAAFFIGLPLEYLESVLRDTFASKSEKIVTGNLRALRDAFAYAESHFKQHFPYRLPAVEDTTKRLLINGNEALALGAAAGGCRFVGAYPMTPATTVFEWFTAHGDEVGAVTKQAEDEIAAICMVLGASFAGARALTSTSGGGFDLMCETLSLAGMCEIPLVITEVQRGGPSTGLPTRTEQSDLMLALFPAHGEFPHFVLAPSTVEECFEAGWRGLNLAEKYQCPVILLSDAYLGGNSATVDWDSLSLEDVTIDRGALMTQSQLEGAKDFRRFAFTADGISPRSIPGQIGGVHAPSSDEHDEHGHITEAIDNRNKMMGKRMKKREKMVLEMHPPESFGAPEADLTLLSWGSMKGAVVEAAAELTEKGYATKVLHFTDLWPFPAGETIPLLQEAKQIICVEQNYTGQLAQLVRLATGISVDTCVLKYDGRAISPGQVVQAVLKEVREHV